MFITGSLSADGGLVGALNVSPFFNWSLEAVGSSSVFAKFEDVFTTGRRRGCTRVDSNCVDAMMVQVCTLREVSIMNLHRRLVPPLCSWRMANLRHSLIGDTSTIPHVGGDSNQSLG